jgi:hypothetical protein
MSWVCGIQYVCDGFQSHHEFCALSLWQEWTRVWLICELRVSPMLPSFIVDYAARRAMPRATTWLKPQVVNRIKIVGRSKTEGRHSHPPPLCCRHDNQPMAPPMVPPTV